MKSRRIVPKKAVHPWSPRCDAEERKHFLQSIFKVSDQMLSLVNDLLDVSAIESGRFDLHREAHDLVELIDERVGLYRIQAKKRGHCSSGKLGKG